MLKHAERFLVVAEQATLRAALARLVRPLGYRVELASTVKMARQLMANQRFAAAVVAPAGLVGYEPTFLHGIASSIQKLVILADNASAKRLAASFLNALVCTADPLDEERLLAFLDSMTAPQASVQKHGTGGELLHFAGCTLDVAGRIFLSAERQEMALTRGEFALLLAFARHPGRVLSRTQLRNAVDGGSADADDRSIDMLVARLRRKIGPNPANPQFIATFAGEGYRFVPHVQRSEAVPNAAEEVSSVRKGSQPERRQVTILSCQIIGFATLAAKLDPEDLEHLVTPVYAACSDIIGRFGGAMVRALGDDVLAYFGHLKAQENDAECAVRAALELLRAIRNLEGLPDRKLRARVGIATGLMLVGELKSIGGREAGVMGEALNTALHMQKAAPPDGIVIASSTRALIGRFFRCRQIAPIEMEDGSEPVPAWQVADKIAASPRFEALRRDGMLDLVGREAELERLRQCWSKVLRGVGQAVLLTGEAGIGKSRLVVELEERLCEEPHAVIRYSGSPHRTDAPMSVLIDELQRSLRFAADDTAVQKVENLKEEFTAPGSGGAEAVALACALLGLPCDASPQISQLSPQKRKERTFAVLLTRIETLAARQPVFTLVEDAHWVDPSSLEFISLLVERASAMRLLLVIVARPEFIPPWPEYSYLTTLALPRLSHADSVLLIEQAANNRRIPATVEADIIARADGVPLFVEELTKSLLETSINRRNGGALRPSTAGTGPIPSTLHGLLLARFDRLDRGKEAAQAGAVIGREFSFELLRLVAGLDEPELRGALDQLVASGLVFCRGVPPEATYVFKHALMREAAYDMLPRERRRMLHAGLARAYEENLVDAAQAQPELLAYHWREAGDSVKAVGYLLTAAERALYRSATLEALSHLAQGRELISNQPANKQRLQLELTLELTSARALLATRGYTAIETRQAYQRARECCEAMSDQSSLPLIMHGQWLGAWTAGEHQSALERARELYSWGDRNRDQVGFAMAHADLGMTLTTLGRLVEAHHDLDQALKIDRFVLPGRQPFVASDVDGRISALSFMHNCLLLLGFLDKAKATAKEAASLNPQNLYSQALAQTRTLRMRFFERDAPAAAELGPAVVRLCQEQGYPHFISTAMIYSGWAMAKCGDPAGGTALCERGVAQLQNVGAKCWLPLHLALLAECYEQAADRHRAAETVAEALESIETTGERLWESEIYRLKGTLLLGAGSDAAAAEACFVTALDKARARQTKLLELRAAMSLAHLFLRRHKSRQARGVLAPVYESFTEGFEFVDLREAKMLLDTLAESLRRGNRRSIVGPV